MTAFPDAVIVFAGSSHKHEEEDGDVHLCEFGAKSLYRRLDLPKYIDVEKVKGNSMTEFSALAPGRPNRVFSGKSESLTTSDLLVDVPASGRPLDSAQWCDC